MRILPKRTVEEKLSPMSRLTKNFSLPQVRMSTLSVLSPTAINRKDLEDRGRRAIELTIKRFGHINQTTLRQRVRKYLTYFSKLVTKLFGKVKSLLCPLSGTR